MRTTPGSPTLLSAPPTQPRFVVVKLAFRPSLTAVDDETLAGYIADALRDAGFEPNLLGITVDRIPEALVTGSTG